MRALSNFLLPLSTLSLLALAGCPEDQIGMAHGRLVVTPLSLEFGVVPLASVRTKTIELENNGDAALEIDVSLGGTTDGLRIELMQLTLVPGAKKTFQVTYHPETQVEVMGEIIFKTDSDITPEVRVSVHGRTIAVPFSVEPKAINFGNVRRTRMATQNVVIKNLIDEPLTITVEQIEGSDADDFRLDNLTSTFALQPNGEATLMVTFVPAELGEETAHFDISGDCAVACRERVTLTGVGVESSLNCTPASLDFLAITPNACFTRKVTCSNPETMPVTISSLSIDQETVEYAVRSNAPLTVPAQDDRDIEVDYCPTDLGVDTGSLRIITREIDGGRGMLMVNLRGEGGGPDIAVSPTNLVFGAASGNFHVRRAQVENTGYTGLELRNLRFDPADAPYRIIQPPIPYYIQPGEAQIVEIEFAPLTPGEYLAELVIESNDGDEPELRVTLRGTGLDRIPCDIEVVPSELSYGLVQVGGRYTRQITLRSVGGDSCAFFEPRLERGTLYHFATPPPESGLISPTMQATFDIIYEPTTGSPISGDEDHFLVEVPNETPTTISVLLHAIAAPADLVVYPNPIDFEEIRIGYPRMRTVTIYNVGTNMHTITSLDRVTGSSLDFSMTSTPSLPFDLSPGTSVSIDLTYRSLDVGTDSASLAVLSNALPGPILVDLYGRAGDADCGDITGIICSPDGESASVGARVIVELSTGDTIETITDENGAYYLYCIPPGRVDVNFTRGHFRGRTTTTVVAHQTTVVPEPSCLEAGSANIAVVTGSFDHVEDILTDLGIPHEIHEGNFGLPLVLTDANLMMTYDIIFMNCGMDDFGIRDPVVASNLQMFVDRGGSLYASDFAYDAVEGSFPMQVEFAGDDLTPNDAQQGFITTLQGQVLDPAMLTRLAGQSTVTLTFLGGYVVIDGASSSTNVHVVGETLGAGTGLRPLLVSFQPSETSGRFVYTSFHNRDVFLDPGMRIVLEYLVFEL